MRTARARASRSTPSARDGASQDLQLSLGVDADATVPVVPAVIAVPASVPPGAAIGLARPADAPGRRTAALVDVPARLSALLAQLTALRPRTMGLDTETANFERGGLYRESPSLLQLAYRRADGSVHVAVVDLLAIRDVRALQPFLADPAAVVFCHNYTFDGRMLMRLGLRPCHVYDTCRAGRLLYEGAGRLSDLSERVLERPLPKELQVSDWGRRPLSREQIAYAARDAADTLAIGEVVRAILPAVPEARVPLSGPRRAAYSALLRWREEEAARERRFPEDILPQRALRQVAVTHPTVPRELARLPGIGPTRLARYGPGVLTTLAAVDLAALVDGTMLAGLQIGASCLEDDGIHVRLDAGQSLNSQFVAELPEPIPAALREPHPWRWIAPALARWRMSCPISPAPATSDSPVFPLVPDGG